MLSHIRNTKADQRPEKGPFLWKQEVLTINALRKKSFVIKAERPISHCQTGHIALRNNPYCNMKRPEQKSDKTQTANIQHTKRA